jgi:hypothetical protein
MIWIIILASIIIAVVAITPYFLKKKLNSILTEKVLGYTGKVEHLSIGLFAGHIKLRTLSLHSTAPTEGPKTSLHIPLIAIGFKWGQLLSKTLDLTITLDHPIVHYVPDVPVQQPADPTTPANQHQMLKDSLEKLVAFKINLELIEGEIHYINPHSQPGWAVAIHKLNVHVSDFSNRIHLSNSSQVKVDFQLCDGTGEVNLTVLPLASNLTFAVDFELKSINLVLLNELFRAFGKVDLESGILNLNGKMAVADNAVKGYLQPVLHELDFIGESDQPDSFFQRVRERVLATIFSLLLHRRHGTLSIFIPIDGQLDDPALRNTTEIIAIIRKATIKALMPSVDLSHMWQKVKSNSKSVLRRILPRVYQ